MRGGRKLMVELNDDIIKVIKDVNDVLKDSPFEVNHFRVGSTAADGEMIEIDIRRHEDVKIED